MDYQKKCLVLEKTDTGDTCAFTIDPSGSDSTLINPALVIKKWGAGDDISIRIDRKPVAEKHVRTDLKGDELLIWIDATIDSDTEVSVSRR